ncbi:MAG: tetratricopeptide repeat protein [Acidobacteriota bacterium]|jgi:tetratricopeptide (TPR) repeat protein|nr:tetratricopeptide repeat protein [Acidobacteriota bacterium]
MKNSIFVLLLLGGVVAMAATGQAAGKNEKLDAAIRLYETGSFRQAVGILRQEVKASPRDSEVRLWLGKAYLQTRDWKAAVGEVEKAVELEPSNAQYHLWLGRVCGERASHAFVTTAYSMAKQVVREFQAASALAPDDLDIRFDLLEYYLQAPGMVGGGRDKAEAEARAIAGIDPQKGYSARAAIHKKDKQWNKAKAELTKATAEFPQSADAATELADYLAGRRDYEGALAWSKKALALDPQSKNARFLAASAATFLRRDLDSAADELQKLAAGPLGWYDPSFGQIYRRLGETHLARGDKAKAKAAFQAALAYNPDDSRAKEALDKLK